MVVWAEEFNGYWQLIMDKWWYQGIQDELRSENSEKRPHNGVLPLEDERTNKEVLRTDLLSKFISDVFEHCRLSWATSTAGPRRAMTAYFGYVSP